MTRLRQQELQKTGQLTPAARIVDTFVQPENNNDAFVKAQQLNKVLGEFSGAASRYMDVKHKVYTDDEVIQGQARGAQSKLDFKDAITQGVVPAGASPWYRQGYERERGDLLAQQYSKEAALAYTEWDGKESASPSAYTDFRANFRKQFVDSNVTSSNQLAGFMKRANAHDAHLSATHTSSVIAKVERDRLEVTTNNNSVAITDFIEGNLSEEELVSDIVSRSNAFHLDGGDSAAIRSSVVDAFQTQALMNLDVDLIDQMLGMNISGRGKLGSIPIVKENAEKLRSVIQVRKYTVATRAAADEVKQNEAEVNSTLVSMWRSMADDPLWEADAKQQQLIDKAMQFDPTVAKTIEAYRKIAQSKDSTEDNVDISNLSLQAHTGQIDLADIHLLVKDGVINKQSTAKDLYNIISKRNAREEQKKLRNEATVQANANRQSSLDLASRGKIFGQASWLEKILVDTQTTIGATIKGNPDLLDGTKFQMAGVAKNLFAEEMHQWLNAPAQDNATSRQIIKKANDMRTELMSMSGGDVVATAADDKEEEFNIRKQLKAEVYGDVEWLSKSLFKNRSELVIERDKALSNESSYFVELLKKFNLTTYQQTKDFYDNQFNLTKE